MNANLEGNLARNEALWAAWMREGVTEHTQLAVDFQFNASSESAAFGLAKALVETELDNIRIYATRILWLFKRWSVEGSEHGNWSLEKLQQRTRTLCQLAAGYRCEMDGCGALMVDERRPNQALERTDLAE